MPFDPTTSDPMPQQQWRVRPLLTDEEQKVARDRFELLRPHLEDGVPLTRIAEQTGQKLRTLRRWVSDWRERGMAGLVARRRADRGGRRLAEELRRLIEGLSLQRPRPSARSVHRKVVRVAAERGWRPPSYSLVADIIQRMAPALRMLANQGSKAYSETFDLLHRREAERPNEIWQADHTPLDIRVLDEKGNPGRPWLTVILDDHSRAVTGWRMGFQAPSALYTALTLRQAIWRKSDIRWQVCGIPEVFYTDHGSDFTSRHLEQVAIDLKFQAIFSAVARPRGRGKIERFFGVVNELFLSEQPGYSPPAEPPAAPSLTLAQLEQRFNEFVLSDYHLRVHTETKMAPRDRWRARAFIPRMPESLEQLDLLLLTVPRSRLVRRDGIFFQSLRYIDTTLAAYVGEVVIIRYDPRDLAEIRVFHNDRFLCRAICQQLAGQTVALKDIVQARRERRRQLRDEIKQRTRMVDLLLEAKSQEASTLPLPPPPSTRSRLKRYFNDDD